MVPYLIVCVLGLYIGPVFVTTQLLVPRTLSIYIELYRHIIHVGPNRSIFGLTLFWQCKDESTSEVLRMHVHLVRELVFLAILWPYGVTAYDKHYWRTDQSQRVKTVKKMVEIARKYFPDR